EAGAQGLSRADLDGGRLTRLVLEQRIATELILSGARHEGGEGGEGAGGAAGGRGGGRGRGGPAPGPAAGRGAGQRRVVRRVPAPAQPAGVDRALPAAHRPGRTAGRRAPRP